MLNVDGQKMDCQKNVRTKKPARENRLFATVFDRQTVGSILHYSLLSNYSSLNSQKNSLLTNDNVLIDLDSVRTEMNTILIP